MLGGEEKDPTENSSTSQTGGEGGTDASEETLHQEGENQFQGPKTGHQVGRDQLKGLGFGCEGQQTRESQTFRRVIMSARSGNLSPYRDTATMSAR